MKTDLIIFDMDGTLIESEKISKEAWILSGKEYGINITDEIFLNRFLGTNRAHIEAQLKLLFGEDFNSTRFVDYTNSRHDELINEKGIEVKKGLIELLNHLDRLGIKKAVATSSPRNRCEHMLKLANIIDRFDYIVCGNEVKKSKPNPDIFLKAAEDFNVNPENCIVFEDSRNGIIAAKNAGMKPIFIPDLLTPTEELRDISFMVMDSFLDAIDLIK